MNLHVYVVILFPNEYPGVYQHRLGYSFLEKIIYYEVTIQLKKGKKQWTTKIHSSACFLQNKKISWMKIIDNKRYIYVVE